MKFCHHLFLICCVFSGLLQLTAGAQDFSCQVKDNKNRRLQVTVLQPPYDMVAYVKMTRKDIVFQGSACLIAPRVLLSAGHNLCIAREPYPVNQLEIWLGVTAPATYSGYQVFATKNNDNIFVLPSFEDDYSPSEDFSIVILPDSTLYKKIGHCFHLTVCDSACLKTIGGQVISITGFPYDQPEFTMWNDATPNFYMDDDNNFKDDTYGVTRLSGSPVWIKQGNDYNVFAIHVSGDKKHKGCSTATPITAAIYAQIVTWCKSHGVKIN